MLCRLFVSFCRLFDRFRGWKRFRCPWCEACYKHSPICRCSTKKELEVAYHWTQGRLEESQGHVKLWAARYEEERKANKNLCHENNKLRAAKYPPKSKVA